MGIVLTHSAKYKPMSFERLIQPYVMATEEYRTLEKGIADLDAEALELESLAAREEDRVKTFNNNKPDSEKISVDPWVSQYRTYAQSLKDKAKELATKGLRHVSRKDLYDLQAQYKTNVRPIEDADKYIKEKAKEQMLLNKSGNIVFDRDFSNGEVSIQDVINNPSLGYTPYDLNNYRTLGVQAAAAASARREQILKDPILGDQYYEILTGYGEEEAERFIKDHSTIPILNQTLTDLKANVPDHLKGVIEDAILEGMKTGLTQKTSYQANRNYQSDDDRYKDVTARIKAEADRLKAQKDLMGDLQDIPSLPSRPIVFTKDFTDVSNLIDPETGNIKYITEITSYDGKLKKPESNYTESKFKSYGPITSSYYSIDTNSTYRKQYDDIKNLLLAQGITEEEFNNMHVNEVNDIIRNINEGKTDARLKNMFVLPTLSSSATDHFMSQLKALNIIPEKITGYTKDTNSSISGKGSYSTETLKSLEDLPYKASDNDVAILGYDAANGVPIMLLNGTYYKLSSNIFDNKDRSNIEAYSSEEGQRKLKEKQQHIQDFIIKYAGRSNEELLNDPEYNVDKILYDKALSDLKAYQIWIKEFMQNPVRTSGIVNETTKAG